MILLNVFIVQNRGIIEHVWEAYDMLHMWKCSFTVVQSIIELLKRKPQKPISHTALHKFYVTDGEFNEKVSIYKQ